MAKIFREFNREKLEQVRNHPYYATARKTIIERADEYSVTEPPIIKFSKIHLYVTSGNREIFEKVHIEYETRMHALFLAYVITEEEKYLSGFATLKESMIRYCTSALARRVTSSGSLSPMK